jgi:hypothetical protein
VLPSEALTVSQKELQFWRTLQKMNFVWEVEDWFIIEDEADAHGGEDVTLPVLLHPLNHGPPPTHTPGEVVRDTLCVEDVLLVKDRPLIDGVLRG